jgi:hypothetical protein
MTGHLSDDFVREAFHAAGEKRYALARLAYPHLLGPHWRWAIVGWAYIKCLDDLVDENASGQRAIETLHAHKEILERVYAGSPIDPGGSGHTSYGQRFCAWDRSCGSPLRASMKEVLEIMEFDLQRRGEVLSREEIDQYLLRIGRVMIDFLFRFAAQRDTKLTAYVSHDICLDCDDIIHRPPVLFSPDLRLFPNVDEIHLNVEFLTVL